jgi:hypothetical protein
MSDSVAATVHPEVCANVSFEPSFTAHQFLLRLQKVSRTTPPHRTLFLYALFLATCGVFGFIAGGATAKAATALMFGTQTLIPFRNVTESDVSRSIVTCYRVP